MAGRSSWRLYTRGYPKHITLTRQLSAGIESFYCDKEKCTTIITNLLINAIKYSNEGGEINIIILSEKKDRVRISVSDQGQGLKDIDVSKLFTFLPGENSRPGSGMDFRTQNFGRTARRQCRRTQ